jgi:hypothetical protein
MHSAEHKILLINGDIKKRVFIMMLVMAIISGSAQIFQKEIEATLKFWTP